MNLFQYILMASVCLSISYIAYLVFFRTDNNFKQLRFFILGSIVLSMILPLSTFKINIGLFQNQKEEINIIPNNSKIVSENTYLPENIDNSNEYSKNNTALKSNLNKINWLFYIKYIYITISMFLIFKMLYHIIILLFQYYKSKKVKYAHYTIISNKRYKNSFSFFGWIFINTESYSKQDRDKIIAHEIIHASQFHSIDMIVIELLSSLMWFNPFIWMMRNSMQLIHEYLADEGVLNTGIDKLKYQELLIHHVTEEKLISISSNFNHSLKKRMIMMSKSKPYKKSKLRILTLLPVSAMLFILVASINGFIPSALLANPKYLDNISLKQIYKTRQNEIFYIPEDTIKKTKKRKSIENKLSDKNNTDVDSNSNNLNDTSKLFHVVDDSQINKLWNICLSSNKSFDLGIPKKKMFVSMHTFPDNKIKIQISNNSRNAGNNTLYIVDGIKTTTNPVTLLNPANIESISVIKNTNMKGINLEFETLIFITTKLKEINQETQR